MAITVTCNPRRPSEGEMIQTLERHDSFAGVRNAVRDFFRPSLSHLAIEPGSAPNENWSQWSIVKAAGMAVASPEQLKRAAFRRKAVRLLAARGLRHRLRRAPARSS